MNLHRPVASTISLLMLSLHCLQSRCGDIAELSPGTRFELSGKAARVEIIETIPLVENEFTRRFHFDSAENPKLKKLRDKFQLEEVIAPGVDEFDKQVRLMEWVHTRFKRFGQPSTAARGALEILAGIEDEHSFFCSQYAQLMVSSAASLGWVSRELALRRHQGVARNGTTEHATTEIWSNQLRKWVMLDPTSNMYLEKDGLPLNAYEIRQEWFYNRGKQLVFVIGSERKRFGKDDLPIFIRRMPGFGDLTVDPDELDKYGFIGYIPNTNLMDAREDYAQMFIVQDELCAGTQWHRRTIPKNPATDPYFPLGQAALQLRLADGQVQVELKTLTPNFHKFEVKIDEQDWHPGRESFAWNLHPGENRIEARTVNAFGVRGPGSIAEIFVGE